MEQQLFSNSHILAWLQYFSEHTQVDLEKVKILDLSLIHISRIRRGVAYT